MKFAYLIEPPFNFRDNEARVTGSDVELARHVFAVLDIKEFEPIETEFSELLPGVSAGKWNMTTGLFATAERKSQAAFSRPIWALPDGLLVARDNPLELSGYTSVASSENCRLAAIRDQFQHRSAARFGVPAERTLIFETYTDAATAVRDGHADAYASVARAHLGFLERNPDFNLEVSTVPANEKEPAFGSFAFSLEDEELRVAVDNVLHDFLASTEHREMMSRFGFSDKDIDLIAP